MAAKYALILDAGLSDTRAYGYKYEDWKPADDNKSPTPPKIEELFEIKKDGGIAKCTPDNVDDYLKDILTVAEDEYKKHVHEDVIKHIQFFMLEVVGEDHIYTQLQHEALVIAINNYLNNPANNKFDTAAAKLESETKQDVYRMISGEEEAAHGWIAANFSLGTLSELGQLSTETVGYLEIEGATAQIAFKPFDNELPLEQLEHGDITRVSMGQKTLDLFLKVYPLGVDKAWEKYLFDLNDLLFTYLILLDVKDPDSPSGREWSENISSVSFEGTGEFNLTRFHTKVNSVLDRLGSPQNHRGSRLLNKHIIKSLKARSFVAGANFYYSTRAAFGRDLNGKPKQSMFSFEEYVTEVQRTTVLTWDMLQFQLRDKIDIMGKAWFLAEWAKCVLAEGFGFTAGTENHVLFRPYNNRSKDAGMSWTLGKMVLLASEGTVDKPASIDRIAEYYDRNLGKRMRLKAVYWEEKLWDWLMLSVLNLWTIESMKSAAVTSWELKIAADKKLKEENDEKKTADLDDELREWLLFRAVDMTTSAKYYKTQQKEVGDADGQEAKYAAFKRAVEGVKAACGPSVAEATKLREEWAEEKAAKEEAAKKN